MAGLSNTFWNSRSHEGKDAFKVIAMEWQLWEIPESACSNQANMLMRQKDHLHCLINFKN
jgi:hypothetical protein